MYRYYHSSSLQLIEGLTCDAGTYNDGKGCKQCTGDTYSGRGATQCTSADAGYQPSSDYGSEIICPWGTYNPAAGSSGGKRNCTLIPAGHKAVLGGTTLKTVQQCPGGTGHCSEGVAKTFSNITNPVYTKCNVGYQLVGDDCIKCPTNTYGDDGFKCIPCPDAHQVSPEGSTNVNACQCNLGYTMEGSRCIPCGGSGQINTYGGGGTMGCSTCPANSTSGPASKVISDCQCNAGYEPGPDRYGNQGCQPCNSINTNKVKGNKGEYPVHPCTGNTIPNHNYVGTACNSVPANSRAAGRPPYTDFICNTGYVYDKPSNSCKPDDSLQWAPCFNGDVGARRGPFECNLGRGNVGPFWTRIGSALPNGSFCNINNDCASGVCSVGW